MIIVPQRNMIQPDGTAEYDFLIWVNDVTKSINNATLTGSGTPEGNVAAPVSSLYMDTAGIAGSILYVKRDAEIAGDTTKGWILV